jgi:precorrin-6B methylase 2
MSQAASAPFAHPGQILALSSSYWQSCTLHAAIELDVFTVLGQDALTGADVAERVGGDPHGVTTLLNALCALELLAKTDGRFSNTEVACEHLVATSPQYIGHLIRHHAHLAESWTRLAEAARTGKPVRQRSGVRSEAAQAAFLRGMHVQAMRIAPQTAAKIDLDGRHRLLDLGGGPGTWAIHFALSHPGLQATVFDLPGSKPFAEENIARFGVADRVTFHGGDFTGGDLPGGFDVAWLSHILHGQGPETCREIVSQAGASVGPGGLILIHEFILEEDGTRPTFPALFSLNMLLGSNGGRSYTRGELEAMLRSAGAGDFRLLDFTGPSESRILAGVVRQR